MVRPVEGGRVDSAGSILKFIGKGRGGTAHALPANHRPGDDRTLCGQRFAPRRWGYIDRADIRDLSRDRLAKWGLCFHCARKLNLE